MMVLKPLPPRSNNTTKPQPAVHKAFAVPVSLSLLYPYNVQLSTDKRSAVALQTPGRVLCTQHTMLYLSRSMSAAQVINDLVATTETVFGMNFSDHNKWLYAITATCRGEAVKGAVGEGNMDFLLSASAQGGWSWAVYVVEKERSSRGRWESMETVCVPKVMKLDGGYFDKAAEKGTVMEV